MILENSYLNLAEIFYSKNLPTPVHRPKMVVFNQELAIQMGGDWSSFSNQPENLSGNNLLPNTTPFSQAYAGHQFGHFNILGDGRAHILGEYKDTNNKLWDIQLKGSGTSQFSRGGDGRAALGPMLREYIISEFMAATKIPTTRSLAVVSTGETVFRDSALPGAILTRLASSHIRVGTFEFANFKGGVDAIRELADYAIHRHYPEIENSGNKYLDFLRSVVLSQAQTVAKWMNLGFVHGVMNTDNMTISGETIDYGPCAFLDSFDPEAVFSSIDHQGRYAFGNQPSIAQWNLSRLAETLLPLFDSNQTKGIELAEEILREFTVYFKKHFFTGLREKLGLLHDFADDEKFFQEFFNNMYEGKKDYSLTFNRLALGESLFPEWENAWQRRVQAEGRTLYEARESMRRSNPLIIPRNYWVEEALRKAHEGNLDLFNELLVAIQNPFKENKKFQSSNENLIPNFRTFCGT